MNTNKTKQDEQLETMIKSRRFYTVYEYNLLRKFNVVPLDLCDDDIDGAYGLFIYLDSYVITMENDSSFRLVILNREFNSHDITQLERWLYTDFVAYEHDFNN